MTDSLLPVLRRRWSPRQFDADHELAPDQLDILLEAARWAPSAGNSQPGPSTR
ncbi:MAG TPA: nitroreductase family protein [Nocardioidaceae bacterium]